MTTMPAGRLRAGSKTGSSDVRRDRPDTFEMLVAHGAFRRGFARLPALARGVAAGDAARAAVVVRYYRDLAMFLHHHHSGEDALIWPKLMQRASLETDLVLRMESQHERVAALLRMADARAGEWVSSGSRRSADWFANTIEQLQVALLEHLDEEERDVLPLIEEHLSVAEWHQLGKHVMRQIPRDKLMLIMGAALERETPEVRRALREAPIPLRLFWRTFGRRAYGRRMATIVGNPA